MVAKTLHAFLVFGWSMNSAMDQSNANANANVESLQNKCTLNTPLFLSKHQQIENNNKMILVQTLLEQFEFK